MSSIITYEKTARHTALQLKAALRKVDIELNRVSRLAISSDKPTSFLQAHERADLVREIYSVRKAIQDTTHRLEADL